MSWCDKLASTPSVGFKIDPIYAPSDDIIRAFIPLFKKQAKEDKAGFEITKQESFGVAFQTDDGFLYSFEPTRIFIDFQHRMKIRPISGGAPEAVLITKPAPYTELLQEVVSRLVEATLAISEKNLLTIQRMGIVTTSQVDIKDAPPGISRFVEYISRPWKGLIDSYNINLTSKILSNELHSDRCVHYLLKSEDLEKLPTIKFDWQRTYAKPLSANSSTINKMMGESIDASLAYFEDLAEGSLFDEDIIKSK